MFMPSFSQPQQILEAWKKTMDGQITRLESLTEQVSQVETQGHTRTTEAIDEAAKLVKDGLSYNQKLATEWRQLMIESTKQTLGMVTGG